MSDRAPEGWTECSLNDVSTVVTKGTTPTTSGASYARSGIKFIRVENISKAGAIDERDLKFIDTQTHDSLKRSQLHAGDLLVSIAGAIGRSAIVRKYNLPANTNQAVGIVRFRNNEVIPDFIRYSIESPYTAKQISDSQAGNAQINLNLAQLGGLRIYRPPLPEQQKIATILSSVDNVIETTRAQTDKLKDLKTGMMQELLTKGIGVDGVPHTEFKDSPVGRIPARWKILPLEELCSKISVGIASSTTHAYSSEGIPLLRNQNILPDAIRRTDMLLISEKFSEKNASKKIRSGDVVTVRTGYPGISAVVPDEYDGCHSFTTLISRPKKTKLNPYFLSMLINSDYGKSFVIGGQAGGAQQNLNVAVLKNFPVILPPLDEQTEMFKLMNGIALKINLINKKLAVLVDAKKALMQDLLTGKVRVNTKQNEKESVVA